MEPALYPNNANIRNTLQQSEAINTELYGAILHFLCYGVFRLRNLPKAHIPLETGFVSANSRVANAENDAQTT